MKLQVLLLWFAFSTATKAGHSGPTGDGDAFKFTRKLYHSYVYENGEDQAILPLQKEHDVPDLGNVFQGIAIPPWASLHKNRSTPGPGAVEIRNIRYKILAGDGEFMFKSDVEIVGNFAFLRLKTRRNADNMLNRERVNRYFLTIRSAVKLYHLGRGNNNYSSGSSLNFNASSIRGDLYGGGSLITTTATVKDEATVEIEVFDENEMLPMFDKFIYEDIFITDKRRLDKPLVTVTARDTDYGRNAEIIYSFTKPEIGFDLDARTGDLFMTRNAFLLPNFIQGLRELRVQAVDRGVPQKRTSFRNAVVKIHYLKKNVMEPIIRFVEERDVESLEKDVGKNSLFEDHLLATLSVFDGDSNGPEAHITYVGLGDYFLNASLPSPFKLVPNFGQKCSRCSRRNTFEAIASQSYLYTTYNWADKFDPCSSYKEYDVLLSLNTLTAHVKAQNLTEASLGVITKYLNSPVYNVKDYGLEMNIMAADAGYPAKRSAEKLIFEKFNAFLLKHAKVEFQKGLYTANITTMTPRNALITKFTASLNGLSVNECPIFEYRIGGGNQNGLFYIDPTTGALFVTNLKPTAQPTFYLVIEARLISNHKFNYYTNRMPLKCRLFFGHLFKNVFNAHKVKPGTTALKIHVNRVEKSNEGEAFSDMREHTVTANIRLDDHLAGYIRIPTADKLTKQISQNLLYELVFLKYSTTLDMSNFRRRSQDLTLNQVLTLDGRSGALVLNTKRLRRFLTESPPLLRHSIYYPMSPIDQTSDGIYRQNLTTSIIIKKRHYDPDKMGNLIKDSALRRIKIVLMISTRFKENLRVEWEIYNPKMHTIVRECDLSINDKNAILPVFDAYKDLITNYFLVQNCDQTEPCNKEHGSYGKGNFIDNSFMENYMTVEKFVKAYAGLAFLTYDQPQVSKGGSIHFDTGIISYNSDGMRGWQNTTVRIAVIDKHRWLILSFVHMILTNPRQLNKENNGILCKRRDPKQELTLTNPLEQRMIALKSRWVRFSLLQTWLRRIDASNPVLLNIEVPENFNSSGATIFKIPRNQITMVPGAAERPDMVNLIDELSELDTVSFRFAIVGGNEQAHFDVDPTSGSVSLIRALDYEDQNTYSLNVEVSVTFVSDDNLALLFKSILKVYVLDVNDNAPYFVDMRGIPQPTYHFYLDLFPSPDHGILAFKDRNVSLGRIRAQDLDGTKANSKIRYIAKGGSELTVNPDTGEVFYRVKWGLNFGDSTCGWNFNDILKYIQAVDSQTMTYEVIANNEMTIINPTAALSESSYGTIMVHVYVRHPMTLEPHPCPDIDHRLEDEEFYRRPIDVKIKPETPLFSVVAALPEPILSPRNDARILRYLEKCIEAGQILNNLRNYTASDVTCVKTYMWHDGQQMGDIEQNVKHRHNKRSRHMSHLFSNDYLLLDPFNGHLRLLARPSLLPNRMTFMLNRGIICGAGKDMIGEFSSPLYFKMESGSTDFVEISLSFYPTSQHRFPYPRLGEEMLTITNGSSLAPDPSYPLVALSLPPFPRNYQSVPVSNEITPLVKAKNLDAEQDSTFPPEAVKYSLEYPDPVEIASLSHSSQNEVLPWKLFKINETSGAIYARDDVDHLLSPICTGIDPSDHWITLRATYLSQSKSTRVPVHFKVGGAKEPTYPFSLKLSYKVSIPENSPAYTAVAIIRASDTYTLSTTLNCAPINSSASHETLFGGDDVTFPLLALGHNLSETMAPTVSFALSGSDAKYFDINPLTGLLTTGEVVNVLTLDREKKSSYVVTVVMKLSTGTDIILRKCKVYIDLIDVNDNGPRFKKEDHTITIPVSQFGREAPIFTAFAIDKDTGMNAVVNYGFANDDPTIGFNEEPNVVEIKGTKFRIQPATGRVYMDSQTVQNEDTSYVLQVRAFDTVQPDFYQDATYMVRSIHAPSNPTNKPEISPIYTVSVSESTKIGDIIMALEQHDPDGDGLRYWIDERVTEPGAIETFAIDSALNNVILIKPLDYETRTSYNLSIYVTDGTYLLSFKLYINVMDTNDNAPLFTKKLYRVNIYNTIPVGTKITTVRANDVDMEGHLKYTIYHPYYTTSDKTSLGIDESNGDIYVERSFDLDKSLVQLLVVKVSDGFNRPDFAHVLVVVQRDPLIPVLRFERDRYKINLNAPTSPGQGIVQLRLKDINHNSQPQTNHSAKFSIESGDVTSLFGIHPTQGMVYFKRRPSHLMNTMPSMATHQLVIKASTLTNKTLDLTLLDITLNRTNLSRSCGLVGHVPSNTYALMIYHDLPPYSKIFENPSLQAMPTPARYHIESGKWNSYFYVDSLTGSLYTIAHAFHWCGHLDLDPVQMNGKKGCEKNLSIKVALNSPYQDDESFGCADLHKPNEMSTTAYTLNIHLRRPNSRNNIKPKAIEASVARPVVDSTTLINFTNTNNSVKIYKKIVRHIYLPAYPSTIIYQTSKKYSLQMVSNNETYYSLNPKTGVLFMNSLITEPQRVVIELTTIDADETLSLDVHFVELERGKDFAFTYPTYSVSIEENISLRTLSLARVSSFWIYRSLSYNPPTTIYTIVNDPHNYFKIDPTSGIVLADKIERFDWEKQSSYLLVIQANSSFMLEQAIAQSILQIKVLDLNDNAPKFLRNFSSTPIYNITYDDKDHHSVILSCALDVHIGENTSWSEAMLITKIIATDFDSPGANSETIYDITNVSSDIGIDIQPYFDLNPITGELFIRSNFSKLFAANNVLLPTLTLQVKATDGGNSSSLVSSGVALMLNFIYDHNNQPRSLHFYHSFPHIKPLCEIIVAENVTVPSIIASFAPENDGNGITHISYVMECPQKMCDVFELDLNHGFLAVIGRLHYEEESFYQGSINIIDQISGNSLNTKITVKILDVNDNYPVFDRSHYTISLFENIRVGSLIFSVSATDLDVNENGLMKYSIKCMKDATHNCPFVLPNSKKGEIYLGEPLDYETEKIYQLEIKATDCGNPPLSSKAKISIIIVDVNDNSPVFLTNLNDNLTLDIPVQSGYVIYQFFAEDKDTAALSQKELTYSIAAGDEFEFFELGNTTGILRTARILSAPQQFILNVSVYDGLFYAFSTLSINAKSHHRVNDDLSNSVIDNLYPKYDNIYSNNIESHQEFYLNEDVRVGTLVGQVMLPDFMVDQKDSQRDSEIGDRRYLFELLNENKLGRTFRIKPYNGKIYLNARLLSYTQKHMYALSILARDQWLNKKHVVIVRVKITEIPKNRPNFIAKYYDKDLYLNEISPINKTVLKIDMEPKINTSSLEFSILTPNTTKAYATIEPTSGKIWLKRSFWTYYNQFYKSRGTEINPTLSNSVDINQASPAPSGAKLDFIVRARDKRDLRLYSDLPVTLRIHNTIEDEELKLADLFNETYQFTIPENTPPGSIVGQIGPTRNLTNSLNHNCVIVPSYDEDSNDRNRFTIDSYGNIYLTLNETESASLNRENGNQHVFMVEIKLFPEAKQQNYIKLLTKVIIQIESTNIDFPQFDCQGTGRMCQIVKLKEDFIRAFQPSNDQDLFPSIPITIVRATKANSIETFDIKYGIVETTTIYDSEMAKFNNSITLKNTERLFKIDAETGWITVNSQIYNGTNLLDYFDKERIDAYLLNISATLETTSYTQYMIKILDVNDNAPYLDPTQPHFNLTGKGDFRIDINEGPLIAPQKCIMTIGALDMDVDDSLRYFIVSGNEKRHFMIDNFGRLCVTLDGGLDKETLDEYTLVVNITDSKHSITSKVNIKVIDINDNAPVCPEPQKITIPENIPNASFIVMIDAQDKDTTSKGKLVYTFTPPESYNYFDISHSKGIIYTVVNMDREARSTYEIGVRVEDEGGLSCSTSIEITLSDVNDNAPTFERRSSYVLNLLPSLKIGSPIAQIRARDPDTGLNQKIRYSINNSMEGELPFSIDDSSGIIKLLSGSRDKTLYRFKVIARDSGTPELKSAANVVITVSSDNNDSLGVVHLSLSLNVSTNSSVNSTIATIPDLLPNINFAHYTIVSGNKENYFRISNYSGDVILNKPLNSGRNKDAYEINVRIADDTKNMNTKEMSNLKLFINVIPFTENITNISLKTSETCVNSTLSIDLTSKVSTTQATFIPFIEFEPKNESYTVSNVVWQSHYIENTTSFPSSPIPSEINTVNFSEAHKDISTRNEKSIPELALLGDDEIQELPYKINNPDDECCGILYNEPHCHAHKPTNQSNYNRSQSQKYKLLILPIISRHHDKGNRSDSLEINSDDLISLHGNAGESYAKFVLKKWPTSKQTSSISNQPSGTPLHVKFYMKNHYSQHKPHTIFTIKFIKALDKSQYGLSLEMVGGNMLRIRVSTLIGKHSNLSTISQEDDHYTEEEEEAIVGLHNPNAVTTKWYLVEVTADDLSQDKIQITWSPPISSLSDLSRSLIQRGRIIPLPDIFYNVENQTVEFLVGKDLGKGNADGFSGCLGSFELNGWSPFRRNESTRLAIKNKNILIKRRKLVNIDFICKSSITNKSLETFQEAFDATCEKLYHKPSVQKGIEERTKIFASCLKSSEQCKNFCKTVKKLCNPSKSCPDLVLINNFRVHDDYCAYLLPHERANHRDYSIDWSGNASVSLTNNNSTPNKDGKYDPISPTQMLHSVKLFFCFPILALLLATFVLVGVKCMFCPSAHRGQKVKARMYERGGAVSGSRNKKRSANGQHLVATKYGKLTIKYRSKSPDKNGEIALNDTQNVECKLLQALDTRDGVDPNKAKQARTAINSSADASTIQCKDERRSRFSWLKRSKNRKFSNGRSKTTQQELTPLNNTIIRNVLSTAPNIGTETGHIVSTVSTFMPSSSKNCKEPATTSQLQSGQMRRLAQQHKKRKCNKHGTTTVDELSPDHHKLLLDVTSNELKRISKLSNFEADTSPNSQDPFGQSFYVNQPFYFADGGSGTYAENSSEVINLQRKISKMSNELQAALHGSKGIKEENIFKPSPLPKHTKFLVTKEYKISNIERENSLRTNAAMGPSLNSKYVSPGKKKSRPHDSWLPCAPHSHECHNYNFSSRLAPSLEGGYNVKITRPLSFHQPADRGTSLQQERLDTLLSAPTISNSEKDDHSFTELLSLLRSRSSDKSYINRGSNKRIASQDIRLSDENVALLSNDPCNKCNENGEQSDAFGFPESGYDPYDTYHQFSGGIKQPLQSNYVNYPVIRPPLPFNASPKTSSKMGRKHRGFYDEYRFRSLTSLENDSTLEWSQEADIFDIGPNQILTRSSNLNRPTDSCANDADTNNIDPYIFDPSLIPNMTDYTKCSPISIENIPPQNSAVCDKESGNDDIISPIEPPLPNQITLQPVPNFQMPEGTKSGGKKRKKKMLLQTQV